jgi:hypothetical protein
MKKLTLLHLVDVKFPKICLGCGRQAPHPPNEVDDDHWTDDRDFYLQADGRGAAGPPDIALLACNRNETFVLDVPIAVSHIIQNITVSTRGEVNVFFVDRRLGTLALDGQDALPPHLRRFMNPTLLKSITLSTVSIPQRRR